MEIQECPRRLLFSLCLDFSSDLWIRKDESWFWEEENRHFDYHCWEWLITIKEAHDIEARLNEVEKLLKTIINMPWKYSRSEVVLTFFERSPLDQVLKNDNVHKIQPSFQSPVKISEIMRSNGFCLANTETIVIDHSIPNGKEKHLDVDSAEHLFESVSDFTSELEDSDDPTAYVTNLTYYHLVPFETDILD
uniref:PX domain containing 1 n=1 Tax=Cairina moschata TaxID=8855 RepID=A0A8C3BWT0_CAIMO